nr:S9 family peptidase [Corticimicrobacter populi]
MLTGGSMISRSNGILAAAMVGIAFGVAGCAGAPQSAATAESAAQYPLRDFFRNPEKSHFRLSDGGRMLSFMQPVSIDGQPPRMNIYVQALEGSRPVGEPRLLTAESARDISSYAWKGDDTILFQKDFGGDENFHVVAVDVPTGKITDLTPFEGVRAGIEDDLEDDPDHILISHNQREPMVFDVYRYNLRNGTSVRVAENPGNILGWQTDHQGRIRAAIATDGLNSTLLYRDSEEEDFRTLATVDFKTTVSPLFFTFDDRKLYALSNRGRDKIALVIIDPAHPDQEELVFETTEVDLDGAAYSRLRKVLTSAYYQTSTPQQHFFDDSTEKLFARLHSHLPGYEITPQSATRDERKLVVAAWNDRTPGARYIYDVDADSLDKLGDINPWIPEHAMAQVQPVQYTSRDGLTLHGYLTLPPGKPARDLACVVNPHGGPWARDSWGYNPEAQFLANRGFCVLQINFRGSTGYGRAFWEAGFGQWGLRMQDDITDGVNWLVEQGIADPSRIGIYGGSYGGYATLAGITYTPELYAAAVDYVGVSNLLTFMNTVPPYWKPIMPKLYEMVGHPEHDRERLTATSPALNAERIRTPLFIAQGAQDPRVNKAESDQMVEALRQRGIEVEYMVKDNEGHGFHNDENKFEFYEAMERFLTEHLKP